MQRNKTYCFIKKCWHQCKGKTSRFQVGRLWRLFLMGNFDCIAKGKPKENPITSTAQWLIKTKFVCLSCMKPWNEFWKCVLCSDETELELSGDRDFAWVLPVWEKSSSLKAHLSQRNMAQVLHSRFKQMTLKRLFFNSPSELTGLVLPTDKYKGKAFSDKQ